MGEDFDRTTHSLPHLRVLPTLSKTTAEGFALPNPSKPLCPDCGHELKKRYTGAQHGRLSGVRWECSNNDCPVIFVENPDYDKKRIVRDAIQWKP